jgi:undecaprenyl-diphosphatase
MFSVFKNVNRLAGKSELFDGIAVFFARYLVYSMAAALLFYAVAVYNLRLFFYPLLSGLFAILVINKIIYFFYKEHRPAELKRTKVLIPVPKNPSFPSSHASFLFGLSFCLLFYNMPLAVIFLALSCIVGIARVFCGVHWFRDIVAGVLVGLISALALHALANFINL